MKGYLQAIALLAAMCVWATSPAFATARCEMAAEEQLQLQQDTAALQARLKALKGWVKGSPDLTYPVADLFPVNPLDPLAAAQFRQAARKRADMTPDPEPTGCKVLEQEIRSLRQETLLLQQNLDKLTLQFLYLPYNQRRLLMRIMSARQEQVRAANQFATAISELPGAQLTLDSIAASDQLIESRLILLPQVLWALSEEAPKAAEAELLALWRAQQARPPLLPVLDPALANRLDQEQQQAWALLHDNFRALQFILNEELIRLRSTLLDRSSIRHTLLMTGAESDFSAALALEKQALVRQVSDTLQWIWYSMPLDPDRPGKRDYSGFLRDIVFALFMFGLFALAVRSASLIKRGMLSAHDALLRHGRSSHSLNTLSRIFSTLAPIMPWLALWYALVWIGTNIDRSDHPLLYWLLRPAIVYVIYRLLAELAEWLVLRVALGGGNYLSGSKSQQAGRRARKLALVAAMPWLLVYAVEMLIGHSLLSILASVVAWLVFYLILGLLIAPQQHELVENCRRVLPEQLDGILDRIKKWRLPMLWTPLLMPLTLANFARDDLDRLLTDFDWYRSFSASMFRLKTGTETDATGESGSNTNGSADYAQALLDPESHCDTLPFIDSGLLAAVRKPLDAWWADHHQYNTLLLRGERGIGKTTVLNRLICNLETELKDSGLDIRMLSVPKGCWKQADIQALFEEQLDISLKEGPQCLKKLDDSDAPRLLIIDDAHNFFRASVGGLEGWRYFLSLTNVRLENLFWLVSINHQSFAYLSNVFGADFQFANVILAKRWGQQDIRSLILSRNHVANRQISYDEILLSGRGPEAGNLRNAEQRYFALLWDACRGNPAVALHLWLDSVTVSGKRVKAGPPRSLGGLGISKLGDNLQFVYAAIVMHESLTSEDLCKVTSLAEPVVRYALKTGMEAGFLTRTDEGLYTIEISTYQAVINHLARKNMLNE